MYFDFLKYYFKAKNAHGIHSPFVFDFYNSIFKGKNAQEDFSEIENIRKLLLQNNKQIQRVDFGAGKKNNHPERVSDLARTSLKPRKWAQMLYRLISKYQFQNIIDLGTSFGITTLYFSKAAPNGKIKTLEGCPETLKIAKNNFRTLNTNNIETIEGNIDVNLALAINKFEKVDFVFFDANHQYKPTIKYFELCLSKIDENSCFVFDDIYWSEEMKNAWNTIIHHEKVSITIDLFFIGIVFFKKGIIKQHFILK
ncbi:class I SAM-dependent methyltransferase [Lacihabitans sp. LS3-19]|uniref:O-methyltransferase n=1 Tax=Lacihabitans sp. LS3-19 TaxID=2487335 RepID=UPI0020CCE031|nr:class I SAM-dependent methyltransferase [Lacihabitans sp. LS3-19]MCP9769922.1 class I SAM-dependent methyltransferase [Lacihabitans sp. LS3-19]